MKPVKSKHDISAVYDAAVHDAAVAYPFEISDQLFAINSDNQELRWKEGKLLVVSWKSLKSYEKYYKHKTHTSPNEEYVTWVTAAPQLQNFCQDYVRNHPQGDLNLRLKQYLGLHFEREYDVFIEMWVDPKDLFRPCVDHQIEDNSCQLMFSDDQPTKAGKIADYPAFYKNLYFKSFRHSPGVPWTGLGYTYDWGNAQSNVGGSEYIISPNSPYEIERVVATANYCSI